MIGISAGAHTRQIINSMQTLGITPPQTVTEAYDRMNRINAGLRGLGSSAGLAEAAARAIADGGDPATDADVQRILNMAALGSVTHGVETAATDELAATLRAQADQLVKAWRKPFDQAVATLTEAHQILGSVPLAETEAIIGRGGQAAEAWGRAQAATRTIDAIEPGWFALASICRCDLTRRHMILRTADVDPEVWLDQNLTDQKMRPWDMLCAGLTLSLPTPQEYKERARAIEQTANERAAAYAREIQNRASGKRDDLATLRL